MRIVQLSDTHLAATGTPAAQLARAQLERAVAQAATLEPDLVLLTGDLTDDGSLDATVEVARIAGRPGVPVLAVAGNHDDRAVVAATFGGAGMARLGRWTVLTAATAVPGRPPKAARASARGGLSIVSGCACAGPARDRASTASTRRIDFETLNPTMQEATLQSSSRRTFTLRPLTLPADRRCSACGAMSRSTAT